ncbi:MAG: VWA domain-containing protein [Bryobacteraceae bacterium]
MSANREMRCPANLIVTAALLLAAAAAVQGGKQSQPPPKPLIDCTDEELSQRVPRLKGVQFDRSPELLNATLNSAAKALNTSRESFEDVAAKEEIYELRLENNGADVDAKREEFRHVFHVPMGDVGSGVPKRLREFRVAGKELQAGQAGGAGFFVLSRFMNLLAFLLPENQTLCHFRAAGRMGSGEAESIVLVYAYIPGSILDSGVVTKEGAASVPMQGVVWVETRTGWPRRVLVEPLVSPSESGMDELRTEVVTAPVSFQSIDATLLMPVLVTTHARQAMVHTHTVHRLTEYRLYGVDSDGDPDAEKSHAGVFTALPPSGDAYELLAQGVTLRLEKKDAEAIAPLREAARLDPGLAVARMHLGLALDATGDSTGAERELREASKQLDGSAPIHNAMGIVLYHRGSAMEAAVEFRKAIGLAPKDPAAHANLATALEKTGDVKGALEQLRAAVQLDPDNAAMKRKLEQLTMASAAAAQRTAEAVPTIRVDVRQVVVPVIVLDRDGHHVSGLKQDDFRVLEDGAEQTITAFQVETSGEAVAGSEPKAGAAAVAEPQKTAGANPAQPGIRHTYLICIDTIHARFGNLHYVQEALRKFFGSQRAGDSQYALIAIGQSMNVLQNLTQDPAKALA